MYGYREQYQSGTYAGQGNRIVSPQERARRQAEQIAAQEAAENSAMGTTGINTARNFTNSMIQPASLGAKGPRATAAVNTIGNNLFEANAPGNPGATAKTVRADIERRYRTTGVFPDTKAIQSLINDGVYTEEELNNLLNSMGGQGRINTKLQQGGYGYQNYGLPNDIVGRY